MNLRKATIHDLPSILAIEKSSYTDPWTEDHFKYELLENPFASFFVAEEKKIIVGYIDLWKTFEIGQINNLAVVLPLRGKGIGRMLIVEAMNYLLKTGCTHITLEVRVSNAIAIRLYTSLGFKILLTKPQYYQDGEDAFFMQCVL
jgi:[ribosomal protein S18]-alanine N-acetyltransferase